MRKNVRPAIVKPSHSSMGCGASSEVLNDAEFNSNAAIARQLPPSQQERAKWSSSTPKMSSGSTNVLITCHTNQQKIAETLRKYLTNLKLTCDILTDIIPQSIVARANLIRWCDVFIVFISRSYQRTFFCMETINYAKDVHKPIIAILAESNFQPYGALGAISASAVRSIILADDDISGDVIETDNDNVNLIHSENQCTILICTVDDGAAVGQLIYNDFGTKNLHVGFENLSKSNSKCSVRQCTLFVPILTPQLEQTPVCRAAFEEARRLQKPIVPAIAIKSWRPEDWLGLTIAGRTFFRIFDKESAYKPFFDSNRITDLRVEVE
ncbi:unnamed protein product, partial [Rotaria sp. Silwood2]